MKKWILMLSAVLVLGACGDQGSGDADGTKQTREERIAEISEMEKDLKSKQSLPFDQVRPLASQMVREYRDFAQVHSKDSLAPAYLFKAADLSVGLEEYEQAIGFLETIDRDYSNYERHVEMLLFTGFIYEQHMNQHGKAVEAYQALIDRYPNHRLAKDAQASIDNLTLSDEELIEKFKKMNEES